MISDFYDDGEIKLENYDNDKFLYFLDNEVNLSEIPLKLNVFVVEN